ncbi:SE1832 family protein [Metabacillus sp. YM-086]|uniref:SE1832 family protein n=1 Tax=Metabacillus sp. YM-086 TaxID=3341729 RepID=UPI003A8C020B
MNAQEVKQKIDELKMEYIRVQGDIEKLESTGHSIEKLEARLEEIESTITEYRTQLSKQS